MEILFMFTGLLVRYGICKLLGIKVNSSKIEGQDTLNGIIGFFVLLGIAFVVVRIIQFFISE